MPRFSSTPYTCRCEHAERKGSLRPRAVHFVFVINYVLAVSDADRDFAVLNHVINSPFLIKQHYRIQCAVEFDICNRLVTYTRVSARSHADLTQLRLSWHAYIDAFDSEKSVYNDYFTEPKYIITLSRYITLSDCPGLIACTHFACVT